MRLNWTVPLALAFGAIAILNTILQAWLWRFPMAPDPTGRDPNGVTTAPRFWRMVHRGLGYVFLAIYIVIMIEMVPRSWRYSEGWNGRVIVHALLGILVGPVLLAKILIIRKFRRFGHRLPWFGGTLCAATLALVGLVIAPAWRIWRGPDTVAPLSTVETAEMGAIVPSGRWVAMNRCLQCHGPGTVLGERRDEEEWFELTADMQDLAAGSTTRLPITDAHRQAVTSYLTTVYGKSDKQPDDNRRGRGKGSDD
jgi:mono/diheme cytochrome c family protein